MTESLVLYWLLPSLVTLLVMMTMGRMQEEPVGEWAKDSWIATLFFAVLYPVAWLLVFIFVIIPALTRERKWGRGEEK